MTAQAIEELCAVLNVAPQTWRYYSTVGVRASRMESTSSPGRIHVSDAFANALKGEMAKERKGKTDSGERSL